MIKVKAQQSLINIFFYIIPSVIVIYRHIDLTIKQSVSILPFVLVGTVALVPIIVWSKKKNKIMKIIENKEIEDRSRKPSTIIYFYTKFAIIFGIVFLLLYYVQFNFKSLTGTMEMIGGSLLVGAIFRVNLAINSGH